jgi:hypothetical protein
MSLWSVFEINSLFFHIKIYFFGGWSLKLQRARFVGLLFQKQKNPSGFRKSFQVNIVGGCSAAKLRSNYNCKKLFLLFINVYFSLLTCSRSRRFWLFNDLPHWNTSVSPIKQVFDKIATNFKHLNYFLPLVLTTNELNHLVQGRISVLAVPTHRSPNHVSGTWTIKTMWA